MIYRVETCDRKFNGKIYRTHNAAEAVKYIRDNVTEGIGYELRMITSNTHINYRLIDVTLNGSAYVNEAVKVPKVIKKLMEEVA